MAARHSITVQIEPGLLGHAAIVVNEPNRQTYAGFGPQVRHAPWSYPKFDVHSVERGGHAPEGDFSSAAGSGQYKTYTIPITEAQAQQALKEIERLRTSVGNYNAFDENVCTTIVNQIMEAAGLGRDSLPRIRPSDNGEYLSDIENALAANPNARVAFDGAGMAHRIPDALRGVQEDYSIVGGGYDTAAERFGRIPGTQGGASAQPPQTLDGRRAGTENNESSSADQTDNDASRPKRYLRGRLVDGSGRTVFETGAPPVPFVPSATLAPQGPASNQPPPSSSRPSAAGTQYAGIGVWPAGDNGSGQALPIYPLPAVLGGAAGSASPDPDMGDWYARWVKPLIEN